MAKALFVCSKNNDISKFTTNVLDTMARRLAPDNILPEYKEIQRTEKTLSVVFSPDTLIEAHDGSVILGAAETENQKWWVPGSDIPDGAYCMIRSDGKDIELLTDVAGSRSIWFVVTSEMFIAATSQRAILMVLGSFHPNSSAAAWMLSAGCLGPSNSWDERLQVVPQDSCLSFNRLTWQTTTKTVPVEFSDAGFSKKEYESGFEEALSETFEKLTFDSANSVLALSGGYDSRASLIFFNRLGNVPKCITWGQEEARQLKGTDSNIAAQLTKKYQVSHKFFSTDLSPEPISLLLDRVLMAMEGRIAHLEAALDGFDRYKQLRESGISALIRGDEGFGWITVYDERDVLESVGLLTLRDFSNAARLEAEAFPVQDIPEAMRFKRNHESLAVWRDRLYHQYRMPVILAALAEGRLSYLEQINPMLSRRIIYNVRKQPDSLRTEKMLFRKVIDRLEPQIPIADKSSLGSLGKLLDNEKVRSLFIEELNSQNTTQVLPDTLVRTCLNHLENFKQNTSQTNSRLKSVRNYVPSALLPYARRLRRKLNPPRRELSTSDLLIRSYIVSRMNHILTEDAKSVKIA